MNSEEKNRRAVKQYIALAIPPVGKAMGRVGRCVSAISSTERLQSVFLPCYPENLQDFSGASRLGGSKLALKNMPKQGDLLGFSGHPKRKRHTIKRSTPIKHRILCGRRESDPPPPYAINLISTFEKIGICNGTFFYTHGTQPRTHKKTAPTTILHGHQGLH